MWGGGWVWVGGWYGGECDIVGEGKQGGEERRGSRGKVWRGGGREGGRKKGETRNVLW